jgi:hypothetical protein
MEEGREERAEEMREEAKRREGDIDCECGLQIAHLLRADPPLSHSSCSIRILIFINVAALPQLKVQLGQSAGPQAHVEFPQPRRCRGRRPGGCQRRGGKGRGHCQGKHCTLPSHHDRSSPPSLPRCSSAFPRLPCLQPQILMPC